MATPTVVEPRVLYVYSSMTLDEGAHAALDLEKERSLLESVCLRLRVRMDASPATAELMVKNISPPGLQVLHISSHGFSHGLVAESGVNSGAHILGSDELRLIMEADRQIPLVVLSACNSEHLGVQLLHAGRAQHVVATRCEVEDAVALRFLQLFYTALLAGRTLENAFKLGVHSMDTGNFVLLPPLASHDIALFPASASGPAPSRTDNLPALPLAVAPDTTLRYTRQVMEAWSTEHRGVVMLGEEPGAGASTAALAASSFAVDRAMFPSGAVWVPAADVCGVQGPSAGMCTAGRMPTQQAALDAAACRLWRGIASCVGVRVAPAGTPLPALRAAVLDALAHVRGKFLLILDDLLACECLRHAASSSDHMGAAACLCTAGPLCMPRLMEQLLNSNARAHILITTCKPVQAPNGSAVVAGGIPALPSYTDGDYVHPQPVYPWLGTAVVVLPRMSCSEMCFAMHPIIMITHGEAANPCLAEWAWAHVLQSARAVGDDPAPSAAVNVTTLSVEDAAAFAALQSAGLHIKRGARVDMPPSLRTASREERRRLATGLPSMQALGGNFRALCGLVELLARRPLFAIAVEDAQRLHEEAISVDVPHMRISPKSTVRLVSSTPESSVVAPAPASAFVPFKGHVADMNGAPSRIPAYPPPPTLAHVVSATDPQPIDAAPASLPVAHDGRRSPVGVGWPQGPTMSPGLVSPGFSTGAHAVAGRGFALAAPLPSWPDSQAAPASAPPLPWWVDRSVDRRQAEAALQPYVASRSAGVFLVRGCSEGATKLALSFTAQSKVGGAMAVTHTVIEVQPDGSVVLPVGAAAMLTRFASLEAFLASPAGSFLRTALLPRFGQVVSTDDLLRTSVRAPDGAAGAYGAAAYGPATSSVPPWPRIA